MIVATDFGSPSDATAMLTNAMSSASPGEHILCPPGPYKFSGSVEIRPGKHLIGEGAESIVCTGSRGAFPYFIFSGHGAATLRGFTLTDAGIVIEANRRYGLLIERCAFKGGVGIHAARQVVNVKVSHCRFDGCATGLEATDGQSDNWTIEECAFLRCSIEAARIATTGFSFVRSYFQGGAEPTECFVRFVAPLTSGDSSGRCRFVDCRFGNEQTPPRCTVIVGPAKSIASKRIADLLFSGCHFLGPNSRHGGGVHALEVRTPIVRCIVQGCAFYGYFKGTLVNDVYTGDASVHCQWTGNGVRDEHRLGLGHYWDYDGDHNGVSVHRFTFGGGGRTSDDSAAFEATLAVARRRAQPMFLPPARRDGLYRVQDVNLRSNDVVLADRSTVVRGTQNSTSTLWVVAGHASKILIDGGTWRQCGVVLRHALAKGSGALSECVFRNMEVAGTIGFDLGAALITTWQQCRFISGKRSHIFRCLRQSNVLHFERSRWLDGGGVRFEGASVCAVVNFEKCTMEALKSAPIETGPKNTLYALNIDKCYFERNANGISLSPSGDARVRINLRGNHFAALGAGTVQLNINSRVLVLVQEGNHWIGEFAAGHNGDEARFFALSSPREFRTG